MISFKGRKIALIGGAGFIGHNLALGLAKLGAEVSIVDSLFVNNFMSLRSAQNESKNKALYLKVLHERLDLLEKAGISLYIEDARITI